MEVSVVRRTIFKERALSLDDSRGSKGGLCRACKTKERSQEGICAVSEDLISSHLRNLIIWSYF